MKRYFNDLNKMYSIFKISKYAAVLSSALLVLDVLDLPLKYFELYNSTVVCLISGTVILFIILTAFEFNLFETFLEICKEKLLNIGVKETANSINVKINRGAFGFAFFLQCAAAIGIKNLRLDDLIEEKQ